MPPSMAGAQPTMGIKFQVAQGNGSLATVTQMPEGVAA